MKKILSLLIVALVGFVSVVSCDDEDKVGKLPTPTNVSVSYSEEDARVTVTWDAVDGAVGYVVFYNVFGESAYSKSDILSSPRFILLYFDEGKTYEFKVRASNNNAVSEFSDIVSITIPMGEPEPEPEPIPDEPEGDFAAPSITNIREGLGWLNVTLKDSEAGYEFEFYDRDQIIEGTYLEFIKSNGDGTSEYSVGGLDLDTEYYLRVIAVDGELRSTANRIGYVTTGNIWQLTRNTSPCHLYIEWDDVAANKNWVHPSSTDSGALDRTFWFQLSTDPDFSEGSLVYDLATVSGASAGTYVTSNWNGSTGSGSSTGSSPHLYAFTNVAMGGLEPATTYYFRIRNAADETYEGAALNATNGKSTWSPTVSFTTDAAHVASDNELLFQGFDDVCWQYDHINNASGIIPSGSDWALGKEHTLFVQNLGTGKRFDECGLVTTTDETGATSSALFPFTDNGLLNDGTSNCTELRPMIDDAIPSMNGWYVSKAVYPLQGSLRLNSNSVQNTALVPPPFTDIDANTSITVSCDAGTAYVAASKQTQIKFLVFDGTTYEKKAESSTFTCDYPPVESITNSDGLIVFRPYVNMEHFSWDTTINPGDYVVFWGISDGSNIDRMIIDNLSVVKK